MSLGQNLPGADHLQYHFRGSRQGAAVQGGNNKTQGSLVMKMVKNTQVLSLFHVASGKKMYPGTDFFQESSIKRTLKLQAICAGPSKLTPVLHLLCLHS